MKNLKPVPADKKKSLGKLPTDVRNKMGYAKKGSMMKAKEGKMTDMMFRPTPEQAAKISNDPTRKARLKKLLENRIKNTKPDSSETKQKLKDALKKLGSAASPSAAAAKTIQKLAGAQISDKESERIRRSIPKKAKGGEMKQGYGAARTSGMGLQDEDLIPGKSMDYYKDLM